MAQAIPVTTTTALLLAAGAGTRLHCAAAAMPKCLVDVGGISILERLLNNLDANGIRRLVIVTGYMEERIRDAVSQLVDNIQVDYIDNPDYAISNNIYSLWLAREHIREPFLLVESDLVFARSLLREMLTPGKAAVSEILPWMNGTTVRLDSQHRIQSFDLAGPVNMRDHYKTVNMYSLALDSWEKVVSRLDAHISSGRTSSYYEVVFSEIVAAGDLEFEAVVFPCDRWYEIDTVADQQAANQLITSWPAS